MVLDYRDKVDKAMCLDSAEALAGAWQDPLGQEKLKGIAVPGRDPVITPMHQGKNKRLPGAWQRVTAGMLFDGSSLRQDYVREVTGTKINKQGRWCGFVASAIHRTVC